MSDLSDLEITKRCAEKMGVICGEFHGRLYIAEMSDADAGVYNPLRDDAQLISMAKKFPYEFEQSVIEWCNRLRRGEPYSLNHEFCGRIANGI